MAVMAFRGGLEMGSSGSDQQARMKGEGQQWGFKGKESERKRGERS